MDTLALLGTGLLNCLSPLNLTMLVLGIVVGMVVALLPGLTLVMGVALVLPLTAKMDPTAAIILLTSMYVSGTYGGAFTAILFRIPGEPIDVPMLWDGYTLAKRGKAALALGWTLVAALVGGILSATMMVFLTQPLANFALTFSSPEYFALLLFGLASVVALGRGDMGHALISLSIGLLIGTVGVDPIYGARRFTFDLPILADGIEFLVVMVGAYGVGEVLSRLELGFAKAETRRSDEAHTQLPSWEAIRARRNVLLRSSLLGHVIGLIPGAGATIASFVSYGVESQFGKHREDLGTGIPEGILAPQAAATASVGGALVPLLALGVPGSGATAIMLAALMLHGVPIGPQIMTTSAGLVYTIFASLFLGLVLMCLIGLLAIRPLVKILELPDAAVSAIVLVLCFIGALSIRNNVTDLWLMIGFGVLGYFLERFRFPIAPMILGVILGPLAEENFMNTMISFGNDPTVFFTRPISGSIMALVAIVLLLPIVLHYVSKRPRTEAN